MPQAEHPDPARMTRRPIIDRLLDRAWSEAGRLLENKTPPPTPELAGDAHSVSGTLAWPLACAALASGHWQSQGFRKTLAVREVVETLGLSDARYFASWIKRNFPEWLLDSGIHRINDWGDPVQAPAFVLGLSRSFSPTSLRYLAHALWLSHQGLVKPQGLVVEIGVGYGGLAAANALVSGARTVCIDLPEVVQTARLMMRQNGLESHLADLKNKGQDFCLISNYAFTELSTELQDHYFEEIIRHASRGAILSNAAVFARSIGGRDDKELIDWFRAAGLAANAEIENPILCPSDRQLGNRIITWKPV